MTRSGGRECGWHWFEATFRPDQSYARWFDCDHGRENLEPAGGCIWGEALEQGTRIRGS
jgi:hypothetical protein